YSEKYDPPLYFITFSSPLNSSLDNRERQYVKAGMRRYIIRLPSMTAGLLIITGCAGSRPANVQTATVGAAINEAKAGIEEYLRTEDAKRAGISLKAAEFSFQVTATGGAGMAANILVFRAGVAATDQNVQAVTYPYP